MSDELASPDWIELTSAPLKPSAAIAFAAVPEAGAVDVFLGTVRAEKHPEHGDLTALDYSAYEEMAAKQLRQLVADARTRWPICRAAVLHRLGRCGTGQLSVVIAVSTAHRAAAFAACQFLIDQIKQSVPIWKKDIYTTHESWHRDPPHKPPG